MKKFLYLSVLLISQNLLSLDFEVSKNHFRVDNIDIKVDENIKLTKKEKEFPLEIYGENVERYYVIKTEKELKSAIDDFVSKRFKKITIECVYRNHCMIDEDASFIYKIYNETNIKNNKIRLISPKYDIDFTTSDFLKSPFILIRNIDEEYLKNVQKIKVEEKKLRIFKMNWDKMETENNKKILTNMFIRKFLYTDYKVYKNLINNENIPHFLSTIIGSEYCNVRVDGFKILTNKKCDIPLYDDKSSKYNSLFVNGFYYIGKITSKKKTENGFIYTIKDTDKLKENIYNYEKNYSQKNLNYFVNVINIKMKHKDQFDKYFLNMIENKKYQKKRYNELKKFIDENEIEGLEELYTKFKEKMDKENTYEYRNN